MTDTRNSRSNKPDSRAESASDQAVAWMARQLRWEQTLAGLRAGGDADDSAATSRQAA
jgi:hypothetical protein